MKKTEQALAYEWYVGKNQTAKQTAQKVGVSENTVNTWVKKYAWKEQRQARIQQSKSRIKNLQAIIDLLGENRIALENEIKEAEVSQDNNRLISLRKEASKLSDEVSKWGKHLQTINKENQVSLAVHLEIIEHLFEDLSHYDPKLYQQSIDFQEDYVSKISLKY